MYLKLDESKWHRHTQEWSDRLEGTGKIEVYKGQIEVVEDVAPIRHAHWTIIYESTAGVTDAKCSNCGFESLAYENDVHTDERCNYCPCCGAKMDEEVETDE